MGESEILNHTKYVVFRDKSHNFSILLYDESGNAKIVCQFNRDKFKKKIKQKIKWLLFKMSEQSSESKPLKSNEEESNKE